MDEEEGLDRILTAANLITLLRLLCIPIFVWLVFGWPHQTAAAILLAVLGATDWIDGFVARRFHQVSTLGKVIDPVADRLLVGTAVIVVMVHGAVPLWFGVATIVREVLVSAMVLAPGRARRQPHRCVVGGQSGDIWTDVRLSRLPAGHGNTDWQGAVRVWRGSGRRRPGAGLVRCHQYVAPARAGARGTGRTTRRPGRWAARGRRAGCASERPYEGGDHGRGRGTRLRPQTSNLPKPMLPLVGRPMMEHIVSLLRRHGITDIVVTVAFLPNAIRSYFGDGSELRGRMVYATEETPLGTAGSVRNAKDELTERFLVISGDVLTDIDLTSVVAFHEKNNALATIALSAVENPLEFGIVITDEDGTIERFLEKPAGARCSATPSTPAFTCSSQRSSTRIPEGRPVDFSGEVFPAVLERATPYSATWPTATGRTSAPRRPT